MPVDMYVGGAEHATRHLIYARFWHKFLFDIGVVSSEEPFTALIHVGLILASDGRKMSKRWNNVINPDDVVSEFGADALRTYELFMGIFTQPCAWDTKGITGVRKFLDKVYRLKEKVDMNLDRNKQLSHILNSIIKKVGEDINQFKFNTAIASLMILAKSMSEQESIGQIDYQQFLRILAPFAPCLTEQIWSELGLEYSIHKSTWPEFDEKALKKDDITIIVQVNGKLRDTIKVQKNVSQEKIVAICKANEKLKKYIEPGFKKVIFVKDKLINFVV